MNGMISLYRSPMSERRIQIESRNEQAKFLDTPLCVEEGKLVSPNQIMQKVTLPYWKVIMQTLLGT